MPDDDDSTIKTDYSIPTDPEGDAILWSGNDAHIEGIIYQMNDWQVRTGNFIALIEHGAVPLSNGNLAVDSVQAVPFVTGLYNDPRDINNPCPDTEARIIEFDTRVGKGTFTRIQALPPPGTGVTIAKYTVVREQAKYLTAWAHIVRGAPGGEGLIAASNGKGTVFIGLFHAQALRATGRDRALVLSVFSKISTTGVIGELTFDKFADYIKVYKKALRDMTPASRPVAEAQIEFFKTIAYKDRDIATEFNLEARIKPPTTLDEVIAMVNGILKDRVRTEEIDQINTGAVSSKDSQFAALISEHKALIEKQAAQLALYADADPYKGGQQQGKKKKTKKTATGKVQPPRDEDGKIINWVEGMDKCKCGGKHLFRDCPDPSTNPSQKKDAPAPDSTAPTATGAANIVEAAPGTLAIKEVSNLTSAQLHGQLHEFFDHANPATVVYDGGANVAEGSTGMSVAGSSVGASVGGSES